MTLDQLGVKYQTDKSHLHHGYLSTYEQYLSKWKDSPITFIEAGIGGYQYADRGGNSAKMWREFFTKARIITFDLHRKLPIEGVEVLQGSQDDPVFIGALPECEVFIDDASHINPLTIATFRLAWPKIKPGGLYVVEDVHTSYWEEHGYQGNSEIIGGPTFDTTMKFFLYQTHGMNAEHIKNWKGWSDALAVDGISFIHFYPKLIIIGKK